MPDDLSWLPEEIEKELNMDVGPIGPEPKAPRIIELPKAQINVSAITQLWIKWLPLSIFFFGMAFVSWTIIQVVMVGRYHDSLGRLGQRIDVIEKKLERLEPRHPETP